MSQVLENLQLFPNTEKTFKIGMWQGTTVAMSLLPKTHNP